MADSVSLKYELMGEKELKAALSSISEGLRVNKSEMELVTAEYGKNAQSVEALTAKGQVLEKIVASQTEKVQALSAALAKEVRAHGESSAAAMKLQTNLNKAKAELAGYTRSLNENNEALQRAGEASDGSSSRTETLSKIMNDCNSRLQLHKSELALITAQYKNNADSSDAAQKAGEVFSKMVEAQAEKVEALRVALEEAEQAEGDNTAAIRDLATEYNNARAELEDLEKQAEDAANETGKFSRSARNAGDDAEDSTKGIDAMTVALGELVAEGIKAVITGLIDLTEKMQEYNTDMSKLEQNARDAGISLETTGQAMRDLNFITGETDSNIEALSNLMQAGFKENNLGEAVEALSGAVIKFPDTLKIESLADSLQETLATGKATGQFAEMLERLGMEVEKFDSGLQRAAKTGREQEYVLNVLAKTGLPQVTQEYNKMNKEQREYSDAQYKLTEAMSDISKKMVPIMTKAIEAITQLLDDHSDAVQNIISLISAIAEIILNVIAILAMVPAPVWLIIAGIIAAVTAISKMSEMFEGAEAVLKLFTGSLSPAQMQIMQLVVVAIALASVLALLAMLFLAIKEGSDKATAAMERMQNVQIKPPDVKMPKVQNAYAKGTLSAANGWALVGEEGPELVAFGGGERVYNAQKTRSMLASDGDDGTGTYIGNLNVYPNEKQWNQLMGLFKQSKRARHDQRKQ